MKYSSTVRPSRKFALIGCGMMSPFGFATSPRMPAIWRNCMMFPLAPDRTIMSMGLKGSDCSVFCIASFTLSVATVQISISSDLRSSSVMTPFWYRFSTFAACSSKSARISFFSGGVLTSWRPIVSPARVA